MARDKPTYRSRATIVFVWGLVSHDRLGRPSSHPLDRPILRLSESPDRERQLPHSMGSPDMALFLDTVCALVRMDLALVGGATTLVVLCLLVAYRDGRALGTRSRPDLSTAPGTRGHPKWWPVEGKSDVTPALQASRSSATFSSSSGTASASSRCLPLSERQTRIAGKQ